MASFFEPIIGSSFDSIAQQRAAYNAMNLRTEENNLARAAQAQAQLNNYLAQLAQWRDAAMSRDVQAQMNQDAADRNLGFQLAAEGVRQRERAEDIASNTKQWQDRLAAENKRTDQMAEAEKNKLALYEQREAEKIANQGGNYAFRYTQVKKAADDANAAYEAIQDQVDELNAQKQALDGKEIDDLTPEELTFKSQFAGRLTGLQKELRAANSDKEQASRAFNNLIASINQNDFDVDEAAHTLTHRPSKRMFTFGQQVQAAKAEQQSPFPPPPTQPAPAQATSGPGFFERMKEPIRNALALPVSVTTGVPSFFGALTSPSDPPSPTPIDKETVKQLLLEAGMDKTKAMELARQRGYTWVE